jgi:hypothetical protein
MLDQQSPVHEDTQQGRPDDSQQRSDEQWQSELDMSSVRQIRADSEKLPVSKVREVSDTK